MLMYNINMSFIRLVQKIVFLPVIISIGLGQPVYLLSGSLITPPQVSELSRQSESPNQQFSINNFFYAIYQNFKTDSEQSKLIMQRGGIPAIIFMDFDALIKEVEKIEYEAEEVFKQRDKITSAGYAHSIDSSKSGQTCKARDKRIDDAFMAADPDCFKENYAVRLYKEESIKNTFLEVYLELLIQRAVNRGRESFFFLSRNPVGIVRFNQLKNPRVPPDTAGKLLDITKDAERIKESKRWARQYFGMHKGRTFASGIGVTEAENGRGMEQRWHQHETTQEFTVSLCDNTEFRVARLLDPGEHEEGKEVIEISDNGKKIRLVVIKTEAVPFGSMIAMPKQTFHTIRNSRPDVPSIDFTVKDPVTQLIKVFSPPEEAQLDKPKIIKPAAAIKNWGAVFTHDYESPYSMKMSINPETGEINYSFDKNGMPVPIMFDQAKLQLDIVLLKSGFTTDNLNFHSLYSEEDLQVVRIFPWPRKIPSDWVLDRDHKLINAAVTAYSVNGEVLFQKENIEGGDIVLLDNSKNPGRRIHSFTITNNSDSGHDLIFFTLKAERSGPEEIVNPSSINTQSAAKAIEYFWNYKFDPKSAAASPSAIGQNPGNHTKKSH